MSHSEKVHVDILMETKVMIAEIKKHNFDFLRNLFKTYITILWCPFLTLYSESLSYSSEN